MTRRRMKMYYLKQKAIGLLMIIVSILSGFIDPELGGCMVFTVGLAGLALMTTRLMIWMDDFYFEVKERREMLESKGRYR